MAFMDYVKLYRDKGKEAWVKLNTRQRWIFAGVGIALVVGFVALISMFGAGSGGRVTIEISGQATPEVAMQKLAEFGIDSKLENGAISVPKDVERRAKMILLSSNYLPNTAEAYKFLFNSDFTTTQHRLTEQQRVALEQVLGSVISNLQGVSDARVMITPAVSPWHYSLPREDMSAKASVHVTLKGQERLPPVQVTAIANLVGHAYATLSPERVAINDQYGRPYRATNDWQDIVEAVERQAQDERAVVMNVENVMGPYRPRVSAHVEVRRMNRVSDSVDFKDGDPKVEYEETRDENERNITRKGTAGAIGEIGREAGADPAGATVNSDREGSERVVKYLYSKSQVTEIQRGLVVVREGVGIVYDEAYKADVEARAAQFKKLISDGTGIPADKISLLAVPMPAMEAGAGGIGGWAGGLLTPKNIMNGVLLVLAIGAFVTLMVMLKKSAPKPLTDVDEDIVEEKVEPMPEVPRLPPVTQLEGNLVREKVVELVKKNPAAAANLIKRWMILGK